MDKQVAEAKRRQEARYAEEDEFEAADGMTVEENVEKMEGVGMGETLIGVKESWKVISELGRGSFGQVVLLENEKTKVKAAAKLESCEAKEKCLRLERLTIEGLSGRPWSLELMDEGLTKIFSFIVMTVLGPSLCEVMALTGGKFSENLAIRCGIRILATLKELHESGFVHRDLKPENIALEQCPTSRALILLDFGLGRQYARKVGGKVLFRRPRISAPFRGNLHYCSLGQHQRMEAGRGDDVESWFYMVVSLWTTLPWTNLKNEFPIQHQKEQMGKFLGIDEKLKKTQWVSAVYQLIKQATERNGSRPSYDLIGNVLIMELRSRAERITAPWPFELQLQKLGKMIATDSKVARSEEEELEFVKERLSKVEVRSAGIQEILGPAADFTKNKEEKEKNTKKTKKDVPKSGENVKKASKESKPTRPSTVGSKDRTSRRKK